MTDNELVSRRMTVDDCRLIRLPTILDARGTLTVVEGDAHVPFKVERIFYIYDIPRRGKRAGHANKNVSEFLIPLTGSFRVSVDDGTSRRTLILHGRDTGFLIPGMIWREIADFSSAAICLVLASEHYDASDYYRDYDQFTAARAGLP